MVLSLHLCNFTQHIEAKNIEAKNTAQTTWTVLLHMEQTILHVYFYRKASAVTIYQYMHTFFYIAWRGQGV